MVTDLEGDVVFLGLELGIVGGIGEHATSGLRGELVVGIDPTGRHGSGTGSIGKPADELMTGYRP